VSWRLSLRAHLWLLTWALLNQLATVFERIAEWTRDVTDSAASRAYVLAERADLWRHVERSRK
jgi:hypothetical protein